MAWHLFGIKSLPQQMLMYCKVQWNFNQNAMIFAQEKVLENVCWMLSIMYRPQTAKNSWDINPLNWLKWLQRACSLNSKINKLCWQWEYITRGRTKHYSYWFINSLCCKLLIHIWFTPLLNTAMAVPTRTLHLIQHLTGIGNPIVEIRWKCWFDNLLWH